MKKTTLFLMSFAMAATACARDLFAPEVHPVAWGEVSLATPIQYPANNWTVEGLRWNIIYGENYGVYGLDLGLVGFNSESAKCLSLYGGVSWTEGDFSGVSLAGLSTVVCGNMAGLEMSGILNYTRGEFVGGQFAPVNFNGQFHGAQLGFFNYDNGICWGLQVGAANAAVNEYHGWSIGLVNYAERLYGLQFGGINLAAETGRGVQIGLFNAANNYTGLQIGLLNILVNGEVPFMPILNAQF